MTGSIEIPNLRERVLGCWLGKAAGGTLGMPFEGDDGPLDVWFYDPVPTGMVPNDDLDLQVLWACKLATMPQPRVDRHVLAQAWLDHVQFPWDEYGVAIRNLRMGIKAPASGSYDNWFAHGMGAAIRTEIWACLAAGNPEVAARYAYEDACVDHAGEGVWAAVFLAALEASAFVESDPHKLLDLALMHLPVTSLVRRCVNDTRLWWALTGDWLEVQKRILDAYGHENFTDVTMNMGFTVLGWLAGGGDFGRSVCIANNCGKDTDCTAATVGSLLGILNPSCIDEKWLKPIGRDLVVDQRITGISPPASLDAFTDLVLDLRRQINYRLPEPEDSTFDADRMGIVAYAEHLPWKQVEPRAKGPRSPEAQRVVLPGTMVRWPRDKFQNEHLLLRYTIHLKEPRRVRIGLNSHEHCRAWIDGKYAFGREGGYMCPAVHRPPLNQFIDIELSAGSHEIAAAIRRPRGEYAEWVFFVGDASSYQWLVDAYERVG